MESGGCGIYGSTPGQLTIEKVIIKNQNIGGLSTSKASLLTIEDSLFEDNLNSGVSLSGMPGTINVLKSKFVSSGIDIRMEADAFLVMNDVQASHSTHYGIAIKTSTEDAGVQVHLEDVIATENGDDGIRLDTSTRHHKNVCVNDTQITYGA